MKEEILKKVSGYIDDNINKDEDSLLGKSLKLKIKVETEESVDAMLEMTIIIMILQDRKEKKENNHV